MLFTAVYSPPLSSLSNFHDSCEWNNFIDKTDKTQLTRNRYFCASSVCLSVCHLQSLKETWIKKQFS
jgi:hypothetical protein